MEKRSFGLMCNCALRYALGRSTYIVSTTIEFMVKNKEMLDDKSLVVMRNDVEYAIERNNAGDPKIDLPQWASFLTFLRKELLDRGICV